MPALAVLLVTLGSGAGIGIVPGVAPKEEVYSVARPAALLLAVIGPRDAAGRRAREQIQRGVVEILTSSSALDVRLADDDVLVDCGGRLTCVAALVRSSGHTPHYVMVVSYLGSGSEESAEKAQIIASLLDIGQLEKQTQKGASPDPDESELEQLGVLDQPDPIYMDSGTNAAAAAAGLVREQFARRFTANRHWFSPASLTLHLGREGAKLDVDGVTLGHLRGRDARVIDLAPGGHVLRLESEAGEVAERSLTFEAGKVKEISGIFAPPRPLHDAVFWSGLTVAAVGLGTTIYAAASAGDPSHATTLCIEPTGGGACFGRGFAATGTAGRGVLLAPLGYSLIAFGASSAVLSLFEDGEEDSFPWLAVGAGVVLGGLSYGISASLDHHRSAP